MRIQHKDHNRPTLEVDYCTVSAKSKIHSPIASGSYLSPGNSIVLEIETASLFISVKNSCRIWGSFVEIQAHFQQTYSFSCFLPSYFPVQLLNDMRIWKGFSALFSLWPNTQVAFASLFFIQIYIFWNKGGPKNCVNKLQLKKKAIRSYQWNQQTQTSRYNLHVHHQQN